MPESTVSECEITLIRAEAREELYVAIYRLCGIRVTEEEVLPYLVK